MRSAREIAQTGHFDPENMDIRPEPNEDNGTVDIVFNLESKANDQVEVSFGWGQTGLIGKLALKFTNFSIKNLFRPGTYKGLIPQGEGQTFTISAQTNAKYYQSYSISFLDVVHVVQVVPVLQVIPLIAQLGLECEVVVRPVETLSEAHCDANHLASWLNGNKNWEKLYKENTTESKKQLYRWIEYWKLRIKSRTYTPLTDPDGKWTLVLMTRADMGLLGSYNMLKIN